MNAPDALVLTAGLGTRLRPLTNDRAKPAVPVAGQALIVRVLQWLAGHGVARVVMNLHAHPETLAAVVGDGAALGIRVRYSWEYPVLGSAGGPRHALPLLETDPFLVVNGDTLTDLDLDALAATHETSGALVTLAATMDRDPSRYGGVIADADNRVLGFSKRGSGEGTLHFLGVQMVQRSVFEPLADGVPAESVGALYPALIARRPGTVVAHVARASFLDVGTPEDYLAACRSVALAEGHAEVPAGRGVRIAPSARVSGSVLWDNVTVEAGATVTCSVLGDGVKVPAGSYLDRLVVVRANGRAPASGERRQGAPDDPDALLITRLDRRLFSESETYDQR